MLLANLVLATALAIPTGVQSTSAPDGGIDFGPATHISNKVMDDHAGPQTIWARTDSNWGVESDQAAGNTAVLSYPSRQDLEYIPISSIKGLRASYSYTNPSGAGDWEGAFDIWVQPNGNRTDWHDDIEVMIWTTNHGQTPAGHIVGTARTPYDQAYTVWLGGAKGKENSIVTLVDQHPTGTSTTHIMSIFRWLIANGYFPATSALLAVEDGWEICSTGGVPKDFTMNSYTLTRELK